MHRRIVLAGLGYVAIAIAAAGLPVESASAQYRPGPHGPGRPPDVRPGNWVLLGEKSVGFRVDRDVIRVSRRDGAFRAIKLRVHGNDIELFDVKVIYGNGEPDTLPVRKFMRQGSETRAIDLRGRTRFIHEILLTYKTRPKFKGQARIEVWGMR
ncbi:MAG: hypothetical protein ACK5JT_24200 [Hyphomicrobiaceae bacterium]